MSLIDNIEVAIPEQTVEFESLLKILAIARSNPNKQLKPQISLVTKKINNPALNFTGKDLKKERFYVEKMPIGFNETRKTSSYQKQKPPLIQVKTDQWGEYLQVKYPFATYTTYSQFNFKQLFDRVGNKIVALDHVGVNINPRLMPKSKYEKMKKIVSRASWLCDYPFEKEWPFIIPATAKEQEQKTIKTGVNRNPKFEFAYDFKYPYPEIQLDIQTNLSPKETLARFPKSLGYYDSTPVIGDYCVNVFIYTGWAGVSLRIDLRWRSNINLTDQLITQGLRVS